MTQKNQYLNRFEEVLNRVSHFYYYSLKKGRNSDIDKSLDQELNSLEEYNKYARWLAKTENLRHF